ncbi:hypothetical protein AQ922_14950 [Burkholderia pseudomallei]|nr:hypothetical protein AQ922_14950 [Burkholderia pseudomallei]
MICVSFRFQAWLFREKLIVLLFTILIREPVPLQICDGLRSRNKRARHQARNGCVVGVDGRESSCLELLQQCSLMTKQHRIMFRLTSIDRLLSHEGRHPHWPIRQLAIRFHELRTLLVRHRVT